MAFTSSGFIFIEGGLAGSPRFGIHKSSDSAVDVAVTGYGTAAGAGSRHRSSDGYKALNLAYGDIMLHVESSNGASPGRCSVHSVVGSTADQASTSASTGFLTAYNVSFSVHAST